MRPKLGFVLKFQNSTKVRFINLAANGGILSIMGRVHKKLTLWVSFPQGGAMGKCCCRWSSASTACSRNNICFRASSVPGCMQTLLPSRLKSWRNANSQSKVSLCLFPHLRVSLRGFSKPRLSFGVALNSLKPLKDERREGFFRNHGSALPARFPLAEPPWWPVPLPPILCTINKNH